MDQSLTGIPSSQTESVEQKFLYSFNIAEEIEIIELSEWLTPSKESTFQKFER